MDVSAEIKARVTMRDAAYRYGFEPNRAGFIACPLHGEKTPSLKIYPDSRGWHCFGCGTGGDVIDFVKMMFHLDFKQAIVKINADFNLMLPLCRTPTHQERRAAYETVKHRDEIKRAKNAVYVRLWTLYEKWAAYDIAIRRYAPKSPDEPIRDEYAEAVKNISYVSYLLDLAEMEVSALDR